MGNWIMDFGIMDDIVDTAREEGFDVKLSVIRDRGSIPAITIETDSPNIPEDFLDFLSDLELNPINPVRKMKRKDGSYGVKFSLST